MMFITGMKVFYDNFYAWVDFVGEAYITLALSPQNKHAARLLVYSQNFKNIQILNETDNSRES
jgi:hypothetical protein